MTNGCVDGKSLHWIWYWASNAYERKWSKRRKIKSENDLKQYFLAASMVKKKNIPPLTKLLMKFFLLLFALAVKLLNWPWKWQRYLSFPSQSTRKQNTNKKMCWHFSVCDLIDLFCIVSFSRLCQTLCLPFHAFKMRNTNQFIQNIYICVHQCLCM